MTRLDDAIQEAGGFGICQILFVSSATVFMWLVAANMGASIFEAYVPLTNCKSPFENEAREVGICFKGLLNESRLKMFKMRSIFKLILNLQRLSPHFLSYLV